MFLGRQDRGAPNALARNLIQLGITNAAIVFPMIPSQFRLCEDGSTVFTTSPSIAEQSLCVGLGLGLLGLGRLRWQPRILY